ncbi:MAG: hypothetical protein JNM27_02130 [Leptospirales bacterium]|nr:hypothetical protein [Leptospirales bacterium]
MLNSITNAMHAIALGTYTVLVYVGLNSGQPNFTAFIFLTFLCVFILKLLGMLVHIPAIDKTRSRHNFFWILISVFVVILNGLTLIAIKVNPWLLVAGLLWTAILAGLYIRSLYGESWGKFGYIALALVGIYGLCAAVSKAELRIAWIFLIASNALWMLLERVEWLRTRKLHNDIYHFALIGSSYYLYSTVPMGLWGA